MLMCQHCKEIWHSEEYRLFPIGMHKQLTNQVSHACAQRARQQQAGQRRKGTFFRLFFVTFDSEVGESLFLA
jgi:hypothetical protein